MGLAELLCAVLFLAALLLYVAAAGSGGAAQGWRSGTLLAAAMGLAICAALAKELGITVVITTLQALLHRVQVEGSGLGQ